MENGLFQKMFGHVPTSSEFYKLSCDTLPQYVNEIIIEHLQVFKTSYSRPYFYEDVIEITDPTNLT